MATTKEIIEALQKADPQGNLEVVIQCEDSVINGWAYDTSSTAELVHCKEGQVDDETDFPPNCVMFKLIL